jgi:phage tail protein X
MGICRAIQPITVDALAAKSAHPTNHCPTMGIYRAIQPITVDALAAKSAAFGLCVAYASHAEGVNINSASRLTNVDLTIAG